MSVLRVIVHVRREGEKEGRDLEVPAQLPAKQLAQMIAEALKWTETDSEARIRYEIRAEADERSLQDDESLADAGVWDGASLLLRAAAARPERAERSACLESEGGRKYALPYPQMRIGRSRSLGEAQDSLEGLVDLRDEPGGQTVSRNHARVALKNGAWLLVPSPQTLNPTLLNGRPLSAGESYRLAEGDRVQVGDVSLRFCLEPVTS